MVLQKTQKTLENAKRSQLGMQSVEEREHQLLMRGNKLRELRLRRDRQLQKQRRLQGATSNALIGGAFPLLFGQGAGASVGGALGGFAGGMMGGQFGFALSLVGTSLGRLSIFLDEHLKHIRYFSFQKCSKLCFPYVSCRRIWWPEGKHWLNAPSTLHSIGIGC